MGRAACEHAAYGLADAPTPDLAFESFLARTLYGRNLAELRWIVAKRVRAPYRAGRQLAWGDDQEPRILGAGRRRIAKALSRSARNLRGFFPWLSFSLVATAICDLIANPCDYHCS